VVRSDRCRVDVTVSDEGNIVAVVVVVVVGRIWCAVRSMLSSSESRMMMDVRSFGRELDAVGLVRFLEVFVDCIADDFSMG